MIRSKTLLVMLISGGIGAGALQVVHAAGASAPSVQKLDDYPHMTEALHHLREAKESLNHAERKFHGHRDAAIGAVDQAIQECEAAIREG